MLNVNFCYHSINVNDKNNIDAWRDSEQNHAYFNSPHVYPICFFFFVENIFKFHKGQTACLFEGDRVSHLMTEYRAYSIEHTYFQSGPFNGENKRILNQSNSKEILKKEKKI